MFDDGAVGGPESVVITLDVDAYRLVGGYKVTLIGEDGAGDAGVVELRKGFSGPVLVAARGMWSVGLSPVGLSPKGPVTPL